MEQAASSREGVIREGGTFPRKDTPMWGWQSLDRQTLAWYEPYENGLGTKGWVSDAIAPGLFFGVAKLHKTEEEAAQRVQAFYQSYLKLQARKDNLQ